MMLTFEGNNDSQGAWPPFANPVAFFSLTLVNKITHFQIEA